MILVDSGLGTAFSVIVGRKACQGDDRKVGGRCEGANCFGEFESIHSRHFDIGYNQVDVIENGLQVFPRILSIDRANNFVSVAFQSSLDMVAEEVGILCQENGWHLFRFYDFLDAFRHEPIWMPSSR